MVRGLTECKCPFSTGVSLKMSSEGLIAVRSAAVSRPVEFLKKAILKIPS